jgi:hypothetical protein
VPPAIERFQMAVHPVLCERKVAGHDGIEDTLVSVHCRDRG